MLDSRRGMNYYWGTSKDLSGSAFLSAPTTAYLWGKLPLLFTISRGSLDGPKDVKARAICFEGLDHIMRRGFIYLIFSEEGLYKIGLTNDTNRRFEEHKRRSPHKLKLIKSFETLDVILSERSLHYIFDSKRIKGEWFNLNSEDLKEFEFWANHEQGMIDYWDQKHNG